MPEWHKALIVCNSVLPPRRRIRRLIDAGTLIVCADGGADRARARGLTPHVIIGDMDSLTPETRAEFLQAALVHVADQNSTDLEKALDHVLALGIGRATVIGATGRRPDHELANLSILAKYHQRLDLHFVDAWCTIRVIDAAVTLDLLPGTTVSLLPLGRCEGITTRGLRYALADEALELGVREGNSNVVEAAPVEISVRQGRLLLFIVDHL